MMRINSLQSSNTYTQYPFYCIEIFFVLIFWELDCRMSQNRCLWIEPDHRSLTSKYPFVFFKNVFIHITMSECHGLSVFIFILFPSNCIFKYLMLKLTILFCIWSLLSVVTSVTHFNWLNLHLIWHLLIF